MFYVFFFSGHIATGTPDTEFMLNDIESTLGEFADPKSFIHACKAFTDKAEAEAYSAVRKAVPKYLDRATGQYV